MLADRSDIGEELARLRIHSGQLAALLDAGGESGKKLDFLLQEMNRETNTSFRRPLEPGRSASRSRNWRWRPRRPSRRSGSSR